MEIFEIRDLLTIKGKSGLWRFKGKTATMVRIQNLLDEKQIFTVPIKDATRINSYKIFLIGSEVSLESVLDSIIDMEDTGLITREELDGFENLSPEAKVLMMKKVVPNYDPEQFKHYHLTKLIKWYKEIMKALDILNAGIVDPYTQTEDETKNEE